MNQQQQHILASTTYGDNTSVIISNNQESKSTAAYISSPSPVTALYPSSPLSPQTDTENIIMSDTIHIHGTDIKDSAISDDNSRLTIAEFNKKKSVRSRFSALKKSKPRSEPEKGLPSNFVFLPSSSTPIPNSLPPFEKRHSTSSTSSSLIKSHNLHLNEKHGGKPRSWNPSFCHDSNNTDTAFKCHSPSSKSTIPPPCPILEAEEKRDMYSSSSSSSSISRYGSPALSQASSSDLNETAYSYNIVPGDCLQSPPTPAADSSMPPSRFLAAFQKIRQQKSPSDYSISTATPSTTSGTTTRTMHALSVTPTSSTIGAGSKSTSFTEKIKTKLKPSWVHSSRSTAIPPPTSPRRQPVRHSATTKKSSSPAVPTLQTSHSSTSIMNRSWSHFSRPFSSPSSLKYSSLHYPQQAKHQQLNERIEGQMSSMYGKRTSSPSHRHSSRSIAAPQHHQQRLVQLPILPSTPIKSSDLKEYRHSTMSRTDHHNGTSGTTWDYSFDANTYIPRGSIIMSPTCSTSSQRSSKSSLSVTVSSSTSASSSPTSLSTDVPHDNKKPLDLRINTNGIPGSTNKSTAPYSPVSHWSLSPAPSGNPIDSSTHHHHHHHHLALKSVGIRGNKTATTTTIESSSTKPKSRNLLHLKTTTSNSNKKKKKKYHVRFVSTAKVQDTFSKHDYDRASDPYAICTRLTAHLAQQIKDELNAFKLEEMLVHHQSRGNTQFFM